MATDVSLHPFPLWLNLLLRVIEVNRLQRKAMCVSHLMLTIIVIATALSHVRTYFEIDCAESSPDAQTSLSIAK